MLPSNGYTLYTTWAYVSSGTEGATSATPMLSSSTSTTMGYVPAGVWFMMQLISVGDASVMLQGMPPMLTTFPVRLPLNPVPVTIKSSPTVSCVSDTAVTVGVREVLYVYQQLDPKPVVFAPQDAW